LLLPSFTKSQSIPIAKIFLEGPIPFFEGKGEKALGKDYLGVAASTKARIFFWTVCGNFSEISPSFRIVRKGERRN